jgi:sporulation protein YlmC with PRC-barrel domain
MLPAVLAALLAIFHLAGFPLPAACETAGQDTRGGQGVHGRAESLPLLSVRALLNRSVHISDKDKTGEIVEIFIDPETGLAALAGLTFKRFVFEKTFIVPVPWQKVAYDPRQETFVVDLAGKGGDQDQQLSYDPTELVTVSADVARKIYALYGMEDLIQSTRRTFARELRRVGGRRPEGPRILRQSTWLLNLPVHTRQGGLVGRIETLYMSLDSGMVRTALVRGEDGRHYSVPYPALEFEPELSSYALRLDLGRVLEASRTPAPDMYMEQGEMRRAYEELQLALLLDAP